ncbi:MAG: Uma2 family endonuclease [Acidobacteriota bacterium]|nr:Uma2 family endonuclease [Acidobacteriota bacterium]
MSANPAPRITPEQYLEAERSAEFKHEYYQGRIFAMSGGTHPHGVIICNFAGEMRQALKSRPCLVSTTDVRVRVSETGLYTYPDILVICGDPADADDRKDTILNPTVIVEVLSRSTEAHDRGFKFAQYWKLDSLKAYILVSQDEARVEIFERRSKEQWILTEYAGMESACRIESIDCEIELSEIYDKVPFAPGG